MTVKINVRARRREFNFSGNGQVPQFRERVLSLRGIEAV